MKKLFTFIFAIALSLNMIGQCSITTAVDFTATDCHGTNVHLFDILDGGQYVLIDFFYTTCGPCNTAAPKVVESYFALGCNMYDVYYMEISDRDSDAACQTWTNTYGVEYPTIAGTAGGGTICNQYGIGAFPTVILIAPDHSIVIQDLWPINNAQTIINALTPYGIEQHDCTAPVTDPAVTITVDQALETEITATFTPNAECVEYHYTMGTESELAQWAASTGLSLPEYVNTYGFPADTELSHTFTDLEPNTEYVICAVPADADGNIYDMAQVTATTTPGGGGEVIVDFTGTDLDGNEIHLYDILDAGQFVLINFFLTGDPFSQDIMGDMVDAYELYGCNQHDVFFMEISPNGGDETCQNWVQTYGVAYPTISRDGGGNTIAQAIPVGLYPTIMLVRPDHTIAQRDIYPPTLEFMIQYMDAEGIVQYECEDGVVEASADAAIYPNPANEFVKISGENLGNVVVYNAMGQKVAEYFAADELTIETAKFESGVYFVKIGGKTQNFVVTH